MRYFFICLSGLVSIGLIIFSIVNMIIHFDDFWIFAIVFGVVILPTFINSVRYWNDPEGFDTYLADQGDMI